MEFLQQLPALLLPLALVAVQPSAPQLLHHLVQLLLHLLTTLGHMLKLCSQALLPLIKIFKRLPGSKVTMLHFPSSYIKSNFLRI